MTALVLAPAALSAGEKAAGREIGAAELIREFRSPDPFLSGRAEGELRRRGREGLPALAAAIDDPEPGFRLRLLDIFADVIRASLDDLDNDTLSQIRDAREREAVLKIRETLPGEIKRLKEELARPPAVAGDPEKERQEAARQAENAQKLRAAEDVLREASDERLKDVEDRLRERSGRVEEGRKSILALGIPAFGPIWRRRESALAELLPAHEKILSELREAMGSEPFAIEPSGGADGPFERRRHVLASVWAREADGKGPEAARAEVLLSAHIARSIGDLGSGDSLLRRRAEEEIFALGDRGFAALEARAGELPPGQAERLDGLLRLRIAPRLEERTGFDFRGYPSLPFRARRRMVIHFARVAGREAIPTLRLIALREDIEPSLRVRLAAAEALAGPSIRDRSALKAFERLAMPELLKIPQIARELSILKGIQLTEEKRLDEAVAEFRKVLEEAPYDFRANYQIAFAYLLLKNYAKAILHFEIARRVQPADDLTLYNLACAYSLDGQIEKALETLEAAAKAGFTDYGHMEKDPDLAPLRKEARFHELIDRLKKGPSVRGA